MAQPKLVSHTEVVIEKNVPLIETRGVRNAVYPWNKMVPGDSFFVAPAKPDNFIRNVYPKNRDGKKFVARKVDGGVRVWRVA